MNLYLIGFMGSGKSSMARLLAKEIDWKLMEMDETIEEECGKLISEIFLNEGEEYFRELESDLLNRIASDRHYLVSCGGGVPLREENIRRMKSSGTVVWLQASAEETFKRIGGGKKRPLLKDKGIKQIEEMMQARKAAYEAAADIAILTDGKTKGEIAALILEVIQGAEAKESNTTPAK